jgi:predicted Zn-dependent peptidase
MVRRSARSTTLSLFCSTSCSREDSRASTYGSLWFALAISLLSYACGSTLPTNVAVDPPPPRSSVEALPPGSALAIKRPTPAVALLSLWIEAGARDAEVPQLAAATAFWAADKVSGKARVLAEGSELRITCEITREPLASCAARLVKALSLPSPSEADATRLRERVRAARAAAVHDDARSAEQLALSALLGEQARALFPLGEERDDAAISAVALKTFLARYYNTAHALLLGLGDVEQRDLERALRDVKRTTPGAARLRKPLSLGSGLRVEVGESGQIALTLPAQSLEQAASLCQRFRTIHGDAGAHISLLEGVTLAHLTLPAGNEPFARLQSAVFDLRRLFLEPAAEAPIPAPDTLDELSRGIGERWLARGGKKVKELSALGVGLLVRRDERTPTADDEALAKARARAESAIEAGAQNSLGSLRGNLDEAGGQVHSHNGARIEITRRSAEPWFSAVLRMEGGSELDAPTGHGRAALLATLLADGCGVAHGRTLDLQLTAISARLSPLVDAEGLGVMISAPRAQAFPALDLLLRCALRPAFQARALEDARARVLQSLWSDDALLLHAALGQLLSPAAPGLLAPWGTPAGVGKVELGELKRLHAQRAQAANISLTITGDVPPRATAEFVARRLAYLPAKQTPELTAQAGAGPEVLAAQVGDSRLRVIVGVHTASGKRGQVAAEVFASELAEALARRIGSASFAAGSSARGHSFAGVALTVRDEQIEAAKPESEAALRELRERPDAYFRNALIRAHAQRNLALSSARGAALFAFAGHASGPLDFAAELALLRKLAREQPSFFVLRPR